MPEQSYPVPDTEHTAEYRGGAEVDTPETSTLTDMARAAVERSFKSGEYQPTPEQLAAVDAIRLISDQIEGHRAKKLRDDALEAA